MKLKHEKTFWGALVGRAKHLTPEIYFLIIFIFFGILFTIVIPPGWNTDEPDHTYRIQQLSEGNLFSEKVNTPRTGLKAYGGNVPTGLVNLYESTGSIEPGATANPAKKVGKNLYSNNLRIMKYKDDGSRTTMNFSGAALYSPISYVIYLPIFLLGRLLSIPFFWVIMGSRLVGVLFTGFAFFIAIKYIPFGKWIIFGVGLIPTVVVQAATVGADAPQLILCILTLTYIVRMLFLPRPDNRVKDYYVVTILGVLLTLTKLVYAPILLLLLVGPLINKEFKRRKDVIFISLTILIAVLPSLIWTRLVAYIDINSNPQANIAAQKIFVLSQPITYLKTLYYTFFTNTQSALSNLFGSFIWDSVPLPSLYAYIATVSVVMTTLIDDTREISTKILSSRKHKIWRSGLLLVSAISVTIIATALYVYSTTYRQSSIVGIQSRYFIPLLPLLLLSFRGNSLKNQRNVKISVLIACILVLAGALLAVYSRLYLSPNLIVV